MEPRRAGFSERPGETGREEEPRAIPFALAAPQQHVSAELYSQLFYTPLYCGHILSPRKFHGAFSIAGEIYESNATERFDYSRRERFARPISLNSSSYR